MRAKYNSSAPTVLAGTMAELQADENGNLKVVLSGSSAAMTSAQFLANVRSTTGAKTPVNSAVSSTTILAANPDRKGATITNTDANTLYLDLSGGTASATSFTVMVGSGEYYEVPYGYTGLITGIWAGDGSGAALVTEFV